jgi:alginate O-acetyltransferase complex protein AlgJ
LLAAETIRDAIQANPVLKKAHDDTPAVKHTLLWATQKFPITGDLIQQLPPNSPKFEKEPAGAFEVRKEGGGGLLGNATGGVALLGSSYTADWTHFPKSVAFALQREVPSIAVTADRGQWVGLDTYLRDDAFQVGRPKLLVWEMPERDLKAPPSMPYREARYVMDNQEWLARVAALAQRTCTASGNKATSTKADAASTTAQDGFEISLTQAATNQEYLSAKLLVNGSKAVTVELSGPDAPARKFVLDVAGDEQEHTFKTPLFTKGKGYTKVKIYPGATKGFAMKNLEMCKQPAGI